MTASGVVADRATPLTRESALGALVAARVTVDVVAVVLGSVATTFLIRSNSEFVPQTVAERGAFGLLAVVACVTSFALHGLYDRQRLTTALEELRGLLRAAPVAAGGIVLVAVLLHRDLAPSWLVLGAVGAVVTAGVARVGVRRVLHRLQAQGVIGTRTVIVGTNREARTVARTLLRNRWLGYRAAGFVTTSQTEADQTIEGLPVLGSVEDLPGMVDRGPLVVVVAGSSLDPEELPDLYRRLHRLPVEVLVAPGLPDVAASRIRVTALDGLPMLTLRPNELSRHQELTKRALDVVGAVLGLVLAAPLMLALAGTIRVMDGPGVLFRQVRVGRGGEPFGMIKFRTMVPDAEERRQELVDRNEADGLLFKVTDDPRITPLGRVLRRWALDELPQLWNVLRGDMSLVGPRPPLPDETVRYDGWVQGRLRVNPGITGLWQVNGRHELSFDDYVRYDLFYVENWSLTLDLYVIARTVPALLSRKGSW